MSSSAHDDQAGLSVTAPGSGAGPAVPDDPDEVRHEIERTREQLGETVEQLAAKADVKKQAQEKAAELRAQMKARASQLAGQAQRAAGRGAGSVQQRRVPVAVAVAATGVLLLGYLVIRRRAGRKS